jgi:hypothetical protein
MGANDDDRSYRAFIDRLVEECRKGHGQVGPNRARKGVWNASASAEQFPEQHDINNFLARISDGGREILAGMLQEAFESGVHATLVALHEARLPPFDRGYEGTPFHDFVGRLAGWGWPSTHRLA